MNRTHTVLPSPVGPLTAVATEGVLSGLYLHGQRHRPGEAAFGVRDDRAFDEVAEQLDGYFSGQLQAFALPLALAGTTFQQRVWAALRQIPYGRTCSYGELAAEIGNPRASRAVGLANGRNPVSIVVPCHRVVGSTGSLTGYGGGPERKQHLLDHERRHAGHPARPLVPALERA